LIPNLLRNGDVDIAVAHSIDLPVREEAANGYVSSGRTNSVNCVGFGLCE